MGKNEQEEFISEVNNVVSNEKNLSPKTAETEIPKFAFDPDKGFAMTSDVITLDKLSKMDLTASQNRLLMGIIAKDEEPADEDVSLVDLSQKTKALYEKLGHQLLNLENSSGEIEKEKFSSNNSKSEQLALSEDDILNKVKQIFSQGINPSKQNPVSNSFKSPPPPPPPPIEDNSVRLQQNASNTMKAPPPPPPPIDNKSKMPPVSNHSLITNKLPPKPPVNNFAEIKQKNENLSNHNIANDPKVEVKKISLVKPIQQFSVNSPKINPLKPEPKKIPDLKELDNLVQNKPNKSDELNLDSLDELFSRTKNNSESPNVDISITKDYTIEDIRGFNVNEKGIFLGISLGKSTREEVIEIFNKFSTKKYSKNGHEPILEFSDISVNVYIDEDNMVNSLEFCENFSGTTEKGLKIGDSIEKAIKLYGTPKMQSARGAFWGGMRLFVSNNETVASIKLQK